MVLNLYEYQFSTAQKSPASNHDFRLSMKKKLTNKSKTFAVGMNNCTSPDSSKYQ